MVLFGVMKNTMRSTSLSWLVILLVFAFLFISPPELDENQFPLYLLLVGLIAWFSNYRLTFSGGEVDVAHLGTLLAYLILGREGEVGTALWVITLGALPGAVIRERRDYRESNIPEFFRHAFTAICISTAQHSLSILVADFVFHALHGSLPLSNFSGQEILPIAGLVAVFLAVYLTLLILDARDRGYRPRFLVSNNWRLLAGALLLPVPFSILGAVIYAQTSIWALATLVGGILLMVHIGFVLLHTRQAYERQVQELSALTLATRTMRTNLNVESLLDVLYLQVARLTGVHNFTVALYDTNTKVIKFPLHIRGQRAIPQSPRPLGNSLIDYVIKTESPLLIVENVEDHAHQMELTPPLETAYSWVGIPLLAPDRALGCIELVSDRPDRLFTAEETRLLNSIAAQASIALDNAYLYERTRSQAKQLQSLTTAVGELSRTLNPNSVVDSITHNAIRVANANAAALYLYNDHRQLTLSAALGFDASFVRAQFMPLLIHNNENIDERYKPLVVQDIQELGKDNPIRKQLEIYNKHAFVETILRNPETYELIGILVVYFSEPAYLSDEHLEVMQTFAKQGALAMTNAQVFLHIDTALHRRVAQLSVLAETGHELVSLKELEEVFKLILDRAIIGTNSNAGTLIIADERYNMGLAKLVAHHGYEEGVIEHFRPMRALRTQVLRTRDVLIVDNVKEHEGYVMLRKRTMSLVNMPMIRGRTVIGVLTLEHDAEKAYTQDDIAFLSQLANEASIAMDNLHLLNSLSEGKDRLQVILDSLREAIVLVDAEGVIALANPQVETLLGIKPERLARRKVFDALTDPALRLSEKLGFEQEKLQGLVRALQAGSWEVSEPRQEYQLFETQTRFLQRNTAPVYDSVGKTIGMLLVFTDVTEERELRQSQEQLSSMIVHDLRGPLTAVNASIKLMQDLAKPEDALGRVILQTTEVSNRAIRKLLNLVNSLLDISKMESGVISLDTEPTRMWDVAEAVIAELTPLADEMEVHLKNAIAPKLSLAEFDGEKIERVLYNLVDNAIKFTPTNGIVTVAAAPLESSPFLRIEVRDTGPGVPDEYKTRLFDRYQMMEGRRGRRPGTGLGLTFCKLAVEAHGGQIWIEDNPSGGSVFVFTLPLEIINQPS